MFQDPKHKFDPVAPPRTTAIGALGHYVAHADPKHYEPSNITFGIIEPLSPAPKGKHERNLAISARALRDPNDQIAVTEVAGEVLTSLARILAMNAVGRATRDRAARTREELAQRRLREALTEQQATLERLHAEITDSGR